MMIERYRGPKRVRLEGERFAALREVKQHTLAHVAGICGVSRQAVLQWEQERALPSDEAIDRLVELYGKDLVGVLDVKVYE